VNSFGCGKRVKIDRASFFSRTQCVSKQDFLEKSFARRERNLSDAQVAEAAQQRDSALLSYRRGVGVGRALGVGLGLGVGVVVT
jgi:hypothetical protein